MTDAPIQPSWPQGPTRLEQRIGNAKMRVISGAVGIPIVVGAIWLGGWAFYAFVALISTGALLEFYWLAEKKGASPNKTLGVIAGLALALVFMPQFGAHMTEASMLVTFSVIAGILVVTSVATLIIQMFRARPNTLESVAATLAGTVYISLSMAMLVGLRNIMHWYVMAAWSSPELRTHRLAHAADLVPFKIGDHISLIFVCITIVTIWICDSGAYYCGRAFGRHKLFERISPKKTWEGAIGGAICAVGATIAAQQFVLGGMHVGIGIGDAIVLGLIIGVFGQVGDLGESQLKRDAGVKDSSNLIPGHGGLLDRFDSLLFVAPLVFLYLLLSLFARAQ